jgi:hypothetical protein
MLTTSVPLQLQQLRIRWGAQPSFLLLCLGFIFTRQRKFAKCAQQVEMGNTEVLWAVLHYIHTDFTDLTCYFASLPHETLSFSSFGLIFNSAYLELQRQGEQKWMKKVY